MAYEFLLPIFEVLAAVSGIMMASSGFPQGFKIFKTKSAKDISLTSRFMLLIGGLIWFAYGILLVNWPIILSNIAGTAAEILVIFGYFLYGRK